MKTIAALVAMLFAVAASADVIYDAGGFEGFALGNLDGQLAGEWSTNTNNGGTEPEVLDFSGTRCVKLDVPVPGGVRVDSGMYLDFADLIAAGYTDVTVEWQYYMPSGPSHNVYHHWNDGWHYAMFAQDNGTVTLLGPDGSVRANTVYDQWVPVRIDIDLTTWIGDGYYNGAFVETEDMSSISDSTFEGWNWELRSDWWQAPHGYHMYVDGVLITAIPEPAGLLLLGLAGLLVRRR